MLRILTAGESHGPALVAILDGMPAGMPLGPEVIDHELARRQQGYGAGARMKIESDRVQILAGVMAGETTGAPIALLIENREHARWKGRAVEPMTVPRPGHADLTGAVKYAYDDLRPALERASARETAARVAAGAVCRQFLGQFGIRLGGYVRAIGGIEARLEGLSLEQRLAAAEGSDVRCPDPQAERQMHDRIEAAMRDRDTLGGVIEIVALDLPAGLGSFAQWDRRVEARLAQALMSVPAIKGVEVGEAFEQARLTGTQAQDAIVPGPAGGKLGRLTNRAGGVEGGVTNGQPLVLRAAMKPIATTLTPQQSVDLASGQPALTRYERSDFCPVPRAVPILEAAAAFILADLLLEKLGGDSLAEMRPRFEALRTASLRDLNMDGTAHTWWP